MSRRKLYLLAAILTLASPVAVHAAEESGSKEAKEAAGRAGNAVISTGDKGATIDADELSKPPKLIKPAKVAYPPQAVGKIDTEVEVTLLVDLDEKGEVTGASVTKPETPTGLGFEEAAQTAAYSLVFEPAELAGKPTAVQITYIFKFPPPKPPAPEPAANPDGGVAEAGAPMDAFKLPPVENFEGVLLERGTRMPMSGVLVTVYRKDGDQPVGFESITDAKGKFHFFDLEPGTWKVFIEPPSYYPFRTTEDIHPSEKISATYYVEKGSYNPFDKVVTAQRERKEVSRTVIENVVIDKMPGAMGDPLAVIQNFAGVNRAQAGTGLVMVRGSAPRDTQIYVDGVTVPLIYHFFGLRSVLPVGMIENLEFYPGNFSSYYGRAGGGTVDVTVKKLKPPKFGGQFDINLLDSSLYLETPIGSKASVAASVRRSYIDFIIDAIMPSNAPVANLTLPRYYDYQLLANYRPAPAHELRFFFFGSDDQFKVLFKNAISNGNELQGNEVSMATNFYRGLFTYKFVPSERLENTLRLSQGRDNGDMQMFQFYSHFTVDTTHLRDTLRYEWSKKLAITAGVDAIYYRVDFHVFSPRAPSEGQEEDTTMFENATETNVKGMNLYQPGAFLEVKWRPVKGLLILPSVRFDYFSDIKRAAAGPRLTVRYQLSKPWAFKGGVGMFYQPPAFTEGETDKNFGNPHLRPQLAIHYSAGVEWKPRDYLNFDVTGFYKDLRNWVSSTDALASDGETPLNYDNGAVGRVYGMEVVAKHDLSKNFTGWLAYTLSRSQRRDSGETSYRLFQYDQTHILTLFASYALPRNWQIGSRFRLVSGNPSTPLDHGVLNASTMEYVPVYGKRYSTRMAPFIQLDIRIDKRWVFDSWMLNAYLDLQNVFNRANAEGIDPNYNFSDTRVQQGFPIYPILGLRGEF